MKNYALKRYILLVIGLGLIPVVFSLRYIQSLPEDGFGIFLTLLILAVSVHQIGAVPLPKTDKQFTISPSTALAVAAIPLFQHDVATTIAWLGTVTAIYPNLKYLKERGWQLTSMRIFFNASVASLSIFVGVTAYHLFFSIFPKDNYLFFTIAMLIASLVMAIVGLMLIVIVVHLDRKINIKTLWGDMQFSIPVETTVNAIGGGSIAIATLEYGITGTLFFVLPLLSAVYVYHYTKSTQEQYIADLEQEVNEKTADLAAAYEKEKETNTQLELLSQAKDKFVAQVTHELRTPLNAIIGFAGLQRENITMLLNIVPENILDEIEEPDDTVFFRRTVRNILEDTHEDAESVLAGGYRLKGLVDELLDIAQIAKGKMHLHIEQTSVEPIVNDLKKEVAGLLSNTVGTNFIVMLDSSIPPVWVDRKRVYQILLNLVSNAIKYAPGQIKLHVAISNNDVCFQVIDQGPGIPEDKIPRLFDRFDRLDRTNTESLGLGLPISLELARLHQGDITVRSQVGEGTAFILTLPINAPALEAESDKQIVAT